MVEREKIQNTNMLELKKKKKKKTKTAKKKKKKVLKRLTKYKSQFSADCQQFMN